MKFQSLVSIALAVTSVLADCNPLKQSGCAPNPALGGSFKEEFHSKSKYFNETKPKGLSYSDDGLAFSLKDRFDNPTIKSKFYIMFGKVEVVMKAAPGQGIVTSFYLQSDDLDEIDIELLGGDTTEFQSNFFSKGNTTTYTRGQFHSTPGDPTKEYFTYTIDWNKDTTTWSLNDQVMRTLKSDDPEGYPQSPMYLMAGIWAGGDPTNPAGTIEWAGGETTYGPTYTMNIKSVIVTDYSTGEKYEYSDKSGSWSSIKAINGQVNGNQEQGDKDFKALQDGQSVSSGNTDFASESDSGSSDSSDSAESTKVAASSEATTEASSSTGRSTRTTAATSAASTGASTGATTGATTSAASTSLAADASTATTVSSRSSSTRSTASTLSTSVSSSETHTIQRSGSLDSSAAGLRPLNILAVILGLFLF